jgi:hypothetical protein
MSFASFSQDLAWARSKRLSIEADSLESDICPALAGLLTHCL